MIGVCIRDTERHLPHVVLCAGVCSGAVASHCRWILLAFIASRLFMSGRSWHVWRRLTLHRQRIDIRFTRVASKTILGSGTVASAFTVRWRFWAYTTGGVFSVKMRLFASNLLASFSFTCPHCLTRPIAAKCRVVYADFYNTARNVFCP